MNIVNKSDKSSSNGNNIYNIANPSQHAAMTEILWSTVHLLQQRLAVCEQKLGIIQQQSSNTPHIINNNNVNNVNNGPLIFLPPPQPQPQPQTSQTQTQNQNVSVHHHIQNQQHSIINNNDHSNHCNNYQPQPPPQLQHGNPYELQPPHQQSQHHMIPQPLIINNINVNNSNNNNKHKEIEMVDSKANILRNV